MCQPCDRIGLSASGAVLNQVSLSCSVFLHISQQFLNAVKLMVTRPYLLDGLLLGIFVHLFNDLRIVFYNTGKLFLGKDIFPEIVCHQAVRIRRIPCAVVIAFVERQEPAVFPGQLCAELDRGIVHGKMHHAALEGEQEIVEISVFLILTHGVFRILLCELVFQLHRDDRKAVDKQADIQSQLPSILRIAQLPWHAEDIFLIHDSGLLVILGRCQVEHDEVCRIDLHTITQDIDYAALSDLAGEPVQELTLLRFGGEHAQFRHFLRLCVLQEAEQPSLVDSVLFVIVGVCSFLVPVLLNQPLYD